MRAIKTCRFEKNPLEFFEIMDDPKLFRKHKTSNVHHPTLELGTNLLNTNELEFGSTLINFGLDYVVEHDSWTGHACALTNSGNVYCWGHHANGRTGNGQGQGNNGPIILRFELPSPALRKSVKESVVPAPPL